MNKALRQRRNRAFAQGKLAQVSWSSPMLDGVGKKVLMRVIKDAADAPDVFLNKIVKSVSVVYDERKQIRITKIIPTGMCSHN